MSAAICISQRTARRFVLGKQGLWPGRRWEGLAGTREAMQAAEYVQLDPLAILARSHDLVLHSRVSGYEPAFFNSLAYEQHEFFEWGGWLAMRPMEELPYWRVVMRREREHAGMREIAEAHGPVIDEMRAALRERRTVTNADFAASGAPTLDHYRGGKATSLALYYLWRTGEAMTHHRERFQRVYAPAEDVAPANLLVEAPEPDADRFLVRKSVAFAGIGRAGRIGMPLGRLLARPVSRAEQTALEQDLVDAGELTPVRVESSRATSFVLTQDLERLETVERGRVPTEWAAPLTPEVSFLSPLDPVSARGRASALFAFEYLWEIYLPAEKVKFGRYTLPVLWADTLVGRVDLKLERGSNTLVANGLWFEDDATASDERFRHAFRIELLRLMNLLGTGTVNVEAIAPGLRAFFVA